MKSGQPKNVAASVKQRLLDLARERGEEFNLLLIRYAIERFLYRLAQSEQADAFVLKGAILFQMWAEIPHRPTRDVDLLGSGSPDLARMEDIFRKICGLKVEDDGLEFNAASVRATRIREEAEYQGIRLHLQAHLGTARVQVQVDIGFGDAITPKPKKRNFLTLLDFSAPRLLIYPWETVIAEKYQALVERDMANSRMKDFFDLRYMAKEFEFDGTILSKAIQATFKRRKTDLPDTLPTALSEKFTEDAMKRTQWEAFRRRSRLGDLNVTLSQVAVEIWSFVQPVTDSLRGGKSLDMTWPPGGPWRKRK